MNEIGGVALPGVERYGRVSITLHWLTVVLVVVAIALIETRGWFPKGSAVRDGMKFFHFQLGSAILLLSVFRLAWAVFAFRPVPVAPRGSGEAVLARVMHGVLYVLLLALPVSGIAVLVIAGKPVSLLGIEVPVWSPGDRPLAKNVESIHELLGNAMILLVGLHAVAALWHEYVRRDGVLQRMLPARQ